MPRSGPARGRGRGGLGAIRQSPLQRRSWLVSQLCDLVLLRTHARPG